MRRLARAALVGLGAWLGLGCGAEPVPSAGKGSVGFNLYISRVAVDRVGAFQIALVQRGSRFDCAQLTRTCLKDYPVPAGDLVKIEDGDGRSHVALIVPSTLAPGTTGQQDAVLRNVPTGTDYTLVIEAMSKESPPRLLGSTCQPRITIRSGNNETLNPNPIDLVDEADGGTGADGGSGLPTCDPRYET